MAVISERFDGMGADGAPVRLGIMGGTFDPVHIGHVASAEQAREAFKLDGVIFVPANNPVFKKDRTVTPAHCRLEMCYLAVCDNPAFDVSSLEIDRGGDTYTVDTLKEIRAHYPANVELYFITGADALAHILEWSESESVARLAHLIAVTRPGYELSQQFRASMALHDEFNIDYLEVTALSVSSSDLRAQIQEGKSIRYLTPPSVFDYICSHNLYRTKCVPTQHDEHTSSAIKGRKISKDATELSEARNRDSDAKEFSEARDRCTDVAFDEFFASRSDDLRRRLKPLRFEHTLGVARTAAHLARLYGVDERHARLAGLLHDWDKIYDDEGIRRRADEIGAAVDAYAYNEMPALLHGPTAAYALANLYPKLPGDVIHAIAVHTTAAIDMTPLDMIIYIADAIEPNRCYGKIDEVRALVGKVPLEELFLSTFQHVLLDLVNRHKQIFPKTFEVWNYYVARVGAAQNPPKRKGLYE